MTPNAVARWESDHSWVFKAPYRVAFGSTHTQNEAGEWVPCAGVVCPVWGDVLPYRSTTVIVDAKEEEAAAFCLACAHGGGWSRRKVLKDGRVALRSDYQAW